MSGGAGAGLLTAKAARCLLCSLLRAALMHALGCFSAIVVYTLMLMHIPLAPRHPLPTPWHASNNVLD